MENPPAQHILDAGVGFINLSPYGFALWARQYYNCRHDFRSPGHWSPVPFFLLCRAMELQFKAWHLENKRQTEVKDEFGHELVEAYEALSTDRKMLNREELRTLRRANAMYVQKAFEYMSVLDAGEAFSRAPELAALDAVAAKIMNEALAQLPDVG